jgi:hypothetical protein
VNFGFDRRFGNGACRLFLGLLFFGLPGMLRAQKISVSGSPGLLAITTAVAGSPPTAVSNSTTTYTMSGNPTKNNKIIAQLNAAMPTGVTLSLQLVPPVGATSLGAVALDVVAKDILTNIPANAKGDVLGITYRLSATAAAGIVPLTSRTVTITIVDLP